MNSQDEPPADDSRPDTREFFFDGEGLSALLIHGLTGTPYEMRYLGERLAAVGVRVRGVRLAGHAQAPEDLGAATCDNWYESVVQAFEELRRYGDPNVLIGLSAGALLAARVAADQREAVDGLVMLAPAFFLPRTTAALLKVLGLLGPFTRRIYIQNDRGSDIHDRGACLVHPSSHLMPLSAPLELLKLSRSVRPKLSRVTQPTLLIHALKDHTCPCERNLGYLVEHLGSAEKLAVTLEESFHVITVDSEKERVASEVIEFIGRFRAAPKRKTAAG